MVINNKLFSTILTPVLWHTSENICTRSSIVPFSLKKKISGLESNNTSDVWISSLTYPQTTTSWHFRFLRMIPAVCVAPSTWDYICPGWAFSFSDALIHSLYKKSSFLDPSSFQSFFPKHAICNLKCSPFIMQSCQLDYTMPKLV